MKMKTRYAPWVNLVIVTTMSTTAVRQRAEGVDAERSG